MNLIIAILFWSFIAFCFFKAISLAIKPKKKQSIKEKETKVVEQDVVEETVVEDTFDEEYLASVAAESISQLVDFGLPEIEARYLLDHLNACHLEEDYLRLIEKCQERRVQLKDERVKALTEKLEAKAAKGVNSNVVEMARDFLTNANSKEQLDRVEQYIAQMRATSTKPKAKVVPKPASKKSSKTA